MSEQKFPFHQVILKRLRIVLNRLRVEPRGNQIEKGQVQALLKIFEEANMLPEEQNEVEMRLNALKEEYDLPRICPDAPHYIDQAIRYMRR